VATTNAIVTILMVSHQLTAAQGQGQLKERLERQSTGLHPCLKRTDW
jgi:hypothetical protein